MVENITRSLKEVEELVNNGRAASFWISFHNQSLCIETSPREQIREVVPLELDMFESLSSFFHGVHRIEYRSHDYTTLKCFINARLMLDRQLNKQSS